jgi:hypothetical protein
MFTVVACVPKETNNPPTQPSLPYPEDGDTGVPLNVTLSWEASDPDGDTLEFDLYFGEQSNLSLEASNLTTKSYEPSELDYNTKYYWKVVAKDPDGKTATSPVWSFTTKTAVLTNLEDLESDDELYIVTSITDENINELTSDVIDYIANIPPLETPEDYVELYEGIQNIYSENEDAIEKLRDMIESSEVLTEKQDLAIEITGEAKEAIIEVLNQLASPVEPVNFNNKKMMGTYNNETEPEVLIFDYRDLMYLRLITGSLLTIYESIDFMEPYIDIFEELSDYDDIFEYFLIPTSYDKINTFVSTYQEYDNPWKQEDFWQDLDELIIELSEEDGDDEYVSFSDLFKNNVLQLPGTDFVIEKLDFFVSTFKNIYDFEKEMTDENGWTDDDQLSLYEFIMTLNGLSTSDDISIKTALDEPVDIQDIPQEILELKFGSTSLLESFTLEDLLTELYDSLPSGQLPLKVKINIPVTVEDSIDIDLSKVKINIPVTVEDSIDIDLTVEASLTLDFDELMNDLLDLRVNNIKVQSDLIDELIEIEIWKKLSPNNMTQEEAEEIYNIVLNNLDFYDPDTGTFTVNIDNGSIITEIKIEIQ